MCENVCNKDGGCKVFYKGPSRPGNKKVGWELALCFSMTPQPEMHNVHIFKPHINIVWSETACHLISRELASQRVLAGNVLAFRPSADPARRHVLRASGVQTE